MLRIFRAFGWMRFAHKVLLAGLLATLGLLSPFYASTARADTPYLVGFLLYRTAPDGTAINDPYFFTSNINISAFREILTASSGPSQTASISFPLATGDNVFTFTPDNQGDPGDYAGIELFFNNTGTSYDPSSPGVAPDLAAYLRTESSALAFPIAGTQIIDYGNSYGSLVSYGGATSFSIGGHTITLTALSIDHTPQGSMTLTVAVPEPGALSLLGLGGVALLRRRRH
jgi:PEP-CTERM motif